MKQPVNESYMCCAVRNTSKLTYSSLNNRQYVEAVSDKYNIGDCAARSCWIHGILSATKPLVRGAD